MSYKIAIASSDGKKVDTHFGQAKGFYIYKVDDEKNFTLIENRDVIQISEVEKKEESHGCDGGGCGCGGGKESLGRVRTIDDCRCLLCARVGGGAKGQLQKKSISVFDLEGDIDTLVKKIIEYFDRVDNHISLRSLSIVEEKDSSYD